MTTMPLAEALAVAETVTPAPATAHRALQALAAALPPSLATASTSSMTRIGAMLALIELEMKQPEPQTLNGHLRELSYAISGFKQRFPDHWPQSQRPLL